MSGILDLLTKRLPLLLRPAAAAAQALHARAHVHAHVSAAALRPSLLEFVANLGAVTHREVVDHKSRVHIVTFFNLGLLVLVEDCVLSAIATDHKAVTFLAES